jgi:hypothetical protein
MKQEFIIGDIVMYKNRIHTIIDILASNGYELSYVRHPVSPVRLSGVPLTPEILEKNGWKKNKDGYFNDSYHIRLCESSTNYVAYKVVNNSIVWLRAVENVSDLQHLLFGLGLNSEMEV